MSEEKVERPKNDVTTTGERIVYPIWRADLAEATIFVEEKWQEKK